uniref:Uncharacterized protein n=1 Tax=Ralstonia solanacearum TaxID=305 RepID=A0A0S4WXL5_RALSL|nr:protein of unknown function [Ralstonia solanacearum]CUV30715.1 protein of unknown function [Ralstonia solanacearum]CUV56317.1 protein of unknown function [Ralstonia solanacearum]
MFCTMSVITLIPFRETSFDRVGLREF